MFLFLAGLVACDGGDGTETCTDEEVPGVVLTVTDEAGAAVADVEATWSEDGGPAQACEATSDTTWACGYRATGSVAWTVDAFGYDPASGTEQVLQGDCAPETVARNVVLAPVTCTEEEVPAVRVTLSSAGGGALTNTAVTWEIAGTGTEYPCDGSGTDWACAPEQTGQINVRGRADGHAEKLSSVSVEQGECHVITKEVALVLDPQ